jgi:hypothetical protein
MGIQAVITAGAASHGPVLYTASGRRCADSSASREGIAINPIFRSFQRSNFFLDDGSYGFKIKVIICIKLTDWGRIGAFGEGC